MSNITTAIDSVYHAFSDIPAPSAISACQCCVDAETLSRLEKLPLRSLSPDDLAPYASSAFLTAGSVEDYLYLLPRILDISVNDESWWPSMEVTGRAIKETAPHNWPITRQDSVNGLFQAAIESFVITGDSYRIDEWVCGIARAGFNVNPLLEIVATDDEAILEYFNKNAAALSGGRLGNEFWEANDLGQDAIIDWMNSEKVRQVAFDTLGFAKPK